MAVIAGCLIWIPIAVIAVCLVQWMVAGDVDFMSGISGLGFAIFLGIVAFKPPTPWAPFASLGAVTATVVFYPILSYFVNRHELNSVDAESVDRIYDSLRERPGNAPAMLRLAKILYFKGYAGHAIAIAEQGLQNMPRGLFPDEHRMVNTWKRAATNEQYFRPVPCLECSQPNSPGQVFCVRCKAPIFSNVIRGSWLGRSFARRVLAVWVALISITLAIPMAASQLSAEGTTVVVPMLVLLAAGILYLGFRKRGDD